MIWTNDPTRLMLVAGMGAAYALVCLAPYLRTRRKRLAAARAKAEAADAGWIVAYASQTGNAEELAQQTAATLKLAGIPVRLAELSELGAEDLQGAERALFLVSTYGEGDAPDAAAAFAGRLMTTSLPLAQLHYAVLALGDTAYAQFCGFGRALDQWLQAQGAQSLFPRVEVNRSSDAAIGQWRQQLSHLAGTSDAPDWSAPAFEAWCLSERVQLNAGSAGEPIYHLELEPASGVLPAWQSGDLVQVAAPADPSRAREYSIASIPADGRVHLLVRLHTHDDGSHGVASGWLTQSAALGASVQLRLRQHQRFRLNGNAERPLILIGNGSGIAGLRGHLKARALAGQGRNWLLFGERNAAHDYHYRAELDGWQRDGVLEKLDMVFSRDQAERRYVQDRLAEQAAEVRAWVDQGAAIYICGSLEGMAAGVDAALEATLGRDGLDALAAAGRYRRDVY
ncbi:sulfite reductase (NADPH) flavoprotein alpha-component [Duganella sp. CF402]|uniref:sulfite reductase subunit alpha n=1 Tax=unclassified Duganella TaxID=2636909 RepID=UPI0008D17FB7|nr:MULTISPECIES: sulfite reductase subunit alpha [unclassified Duganella]RZT09184.1 sulfite reductase (NADPH) flavoprotein alpha-component [Duganella sp. BK701]SEL67333.1 sulfite reductase (NADPH) flavoprotein alpha-component [Duganella sp. CF402]